MQNVHHLAVIMDGNRRWARANGLPTLEGHRRGYDCLEQFVNWCVKRQISTLTVWAFSTENWKRSTEEVGYLMDLLERALRDRLASFHERGVRLKWIGRREGLRPSIMQAIEEAERITAQNTRITLCIALNYGGRAEIVDMVQRVLVDGLRPEDITEEVLSARTYWPEMPPPDLIIRTSGEERLSGFLLWEAPYAELYWCDHHWPGITEEDLDDALRSYAERERRYGQ